jgi:hypothetical protein
MIKKKKIVKLIQDLKEIDSTIELIEILDYPNEDLTGMPSHLPNLKSLEIKGGKLKTLKGISQFLENLEFFIIENTLIEELDYLPDSLNSLRHFELINNQLRTFNNLYFSFPSLKHFCIIEHSLQSLSNMPQNLPNLYNISITCQLLRNLEGFPANVPNLQFIDIGMTKDQDGFKKYIELNLESIKGLPRIIPRLKKITFVNGNLRNLEYFPSNSPDLDHIVFEKSNIFSFVGFDSLPCTPDISLYSCFIFSFEGISFTKSTHFALWNSTIFGLSYLPKKIFKYLLIKFYSGIGNFKNSLRLTPKGQRLFKNCVNWEVYEQYVPREVNGSFSNWYHLRPAGFDNSIAEDPEEWIFGYHLENSLFYEKEIDTLYNFYKKTSLELAYQYRDNTESLSNDEIERLIHESDYRILRIMEPFLSPKDPVISKIISNKIFNLNNGLKIFK